MTGNARMSIRRVFDSWALIALLQDEPSASKVEEFLAEGHERESWIGLTTVNLGEVWYIIARRLSEDRAEEIVERIRQLGLDLHDVDWELAREAARLKSRHRLSCADCFAAALAKQRDAELVTGDPEFRQLEKEIRIRWLRPARQ